MTAITVLGLGAMGSRIAARLADAGHAVTVWNRSAEAATALAESTPVRIAATAREAVVDGEIVISMVADDIASRALWLEPDTGVLAALPDGAVAIEASTITQFMAVELAEAASEAGVPFLEAPVVGSRPQAEAGALFVLVGGDSEVLERVRPALEAFAGGLRPVGSVGNAATMKLAINGLFGMQVAAYAEIVGMLDRSDIPADTAIDILSNLPITSPGLQRILGLFSQRAFAPNFPVALVAKDFAYLCQLAAELGADVPIAETAAAVYEAGRREGQGELDIAGIAVRYLAD